MPDWNGATHGKYQLLAAFLLCCIQLPITFSDQLLRLYGWTPPHRCRLPPQNGSLLNHALSWPIVEKQGKKMFSSCSMYMDPADHSMGIQPCIYGWEYLQSDEEWSLVTEWNLVCEREYLMNLLPYTYTAGAMIGGLLFGILADHYGRRFNLLAALFLHTVLGLALHFLSLFTLFAVGYSLQGILVTAIQCISFTLLLETVSFRCHLKAIVCLCLVTPLGVITLSIVSWLIKNWRYIQLAISAPGIVCLGYFWLIPRSLPWLITEGYTSKAEKQLIQFAKFNKTLLPYNFRIRILSYCKRIKSYSSGSHHSLETVVCSSKIRRYTFILYYMWFVISLESDAYSNDLPALKDNKYALLFVKGLIDTGVLILLYFFAQRFGCRSAHACLLIVGGLLCTGSALLGYNVFFKTITHIIFLISPILAVIGKACIRSAMVTCIFFTLKIFPTGVRAIGLGSCLFWTRAAHLIGIHISTLELESAHYFPLAIFGFLSVIGGCLASFLPSNCHRPLPNVAVEVEKSLVLEGSSRRKRARPLVVEDARRMSPVELEDMNFEEEKNNTLLELSVQEFHNLRLITESRQGDSYLSEMAGPSRLCQTMDKRLSSADREDTESRLTDLEDELCKIWDTSGSPDGENNAGSLGEYRHDDVREHYIKMHETRF